MRLLLETDRTAKEDIELVEVIADGTTQVIVGVVRVARLGCSVGRDLGFHRLLLAFDEVQILFVVS